MKIFRNFLIATLLCGFAALSISLPVAMAQGKPISEKSRDLTAAQILELVTLSRALQDHALYARLDKDRKSTPVGISLQKESIYFKFEDPREVLQMRLTDEAPLLIKETKAGKRLVPSADYGKHIRGTDVTYEDLSMRFLYWPKPVLLGEERVHFQKCWKLRVVNPDKTGPYQSVLIWVHKASGALFQMKGYGWKASRHPIKKFRVTDTQRAGKARILKEMQIETINPKNGRRLGDTSLKVKKPK